MDPFSRFAQYFVAVAESGNLRKAAEHLHISSSSINRQILLAEESMAVQLFERLPTGMKLTAAGELLYGDVRRWQKEYRRTRQHLDDLQGLKRGHVAIATVAALSEGPVMSALAQLCTAYPGVSFTLSTHDSQHISERVVNADIDVGMLLNPEWHQGLQVVQSVDIPMGVVVPPDHPLAGNSRIPLGELSDYRLLLPAAPLVVHEHLRGALQRSSLEQHNPIICNDVHMVRSLVKQGVGPGLLSLLDVQDDTANGKLVFIPLHNRHIKPLKLALCIAASRQLSHAAHIVVSACQQALLQFEGE